MIAGLVLAAGGARRFGRPSSSPSSTASRCCSTRSTRCSRSPSLDRVVVVLGAVAEEIAAAVKFASAEPVVCRDWEEGMAASLRCGVAELPGGRLGGGRARRHAAA